MIEVKAAIHTALEKLQEFYENIESFRDVLLEEVELSEDERYWNVTLGFSVPVSESTSMLVQALAPLTARPPTKYERKYKLFRINAADGTVRAMKMREP